MIIAFHRKKVIANIKKNIRNKKFHAKAEIGDPILNKEESKNIVEIFWRRKDKKPKFDLLVDKIFYLIALLLPRRLTIDCSTPSSLPKSAFITCNHYNQLDILPIKRLAIKSKRPLYFAVRDSNLAMHFPIGFIVRHASSIPIKDGPNYLGRELPNRMKKILDEKSWILIYPEQELWFNYRKPRFVTKGAYYYAAKLNKPIISCFVEMKNDSHNELFQRSFYKVRLVLHILPTIYPDPKLTPSENMKMMMIKDYEQKKEAYEKYYKKQLNYGFTYDDIAGYEKR